MFKLSVLSKYLVKAIREPVSEANPLPELTDFVAFCQSKGRGDLAKKIQDGWVSAFNYISGKTKGARANWPLFEQYGRNHIAKHIFGGSRTKGVFLPEIFTAWLKSHNVELTDEDITMLQNLKERNVPEVPAIAIPAPNETIDKWQVAADNTAEKIIVVRREFAAAAAHLQDWHYRIEDCKRKISQYGEGGAKHLNKDKTVSKLSARIPTWISDINNAEKEIQAIQEQERIFVQLMSTYSHMPITTVGFENAVLGGLNQVLANVEKIEDLKKKMEVLTQLQDLLKKINPQGDDEGAAAASVEVTAGIGGKILGIWNKFRAALVDTLKAIRGLKGGMQTLQNLMSITY